MSIFSRKKAKPRAVIACHPLRVSITNDAERDIYGLTQDEWDGPALYQKVTYSDLREGFVKVELAP